MKSSTRPKNILTLLAGTAGILLFLLPLILQAQQRPQTATTGRTSTTTPASGDQPPQKSIVDYFGDLMTKRAAKDSTIYLVDNVGFHHNGTFIQCDSAHRYDNYRMECFGNVIINKDSTYIYGDRVSYDGHTNIAKVYSPLLKLINGDATMWVYNYMEFNSQTNIGEYNEGGLILQRDNLMESDRGIYNGDSSTIKFIGRVAMRNDNYKIRTDSISYNLHNEVVTFLTKTYIWDKERDFLTADAGRYVRSTETYHFTRSAYAMTADQEFWADTMTYESAIRKVLMHRNIQILDTAQRSIGLGDYGYYSNSLKKGMLTQRPAVINYEQRDTAVRTPVDTMAIADSTGTLLPDSSFTKLKAEPIAPDSAFMRADTIYFDSYPPGFSKPKAAVKPTYSDTSATRADSMITDILSADSVSNHPISSAPAISATDSTANRSDTIPKATFVVPAVDSTHQTDSTTTQPQPMIGVEEPPAPIAPPPTDSLAADSIARPLPDIIAPDSTAQGQDTLERVIRAFYNVKLYRSDMQGICDSLITFGVDSTASLFGRPIIWNGDNQLTADRIDIYSDNEELDYAEFIGNPFITQQVEGADSLFNQAQCRNMEAWFRDNEIYRAILTGNVLNYYYMADEGEAPDKFATISCAGLTIDFENREAIRMNWSGTGNSVIYPIDKIPADQSQRLPGFSWEPDLKPKDRWEITDRSVQPSRRTTVNSYTLPDFVIENKLTGYREQLLKGGTWRDRNELLRFTIDDFRKNKLLF